MRSVLDTKPRMISLALHKDCYAAYDSRRCVLDKVWKGGIHFDGAAFNNLKTIQPASWGEDYYSQKSKNSGWFIEEYNIKLPTKPVYKGYRIREKQITLLFEIPLKDGINIKIEESPEYIHTEENIALRRRFRTRNIPMGTKVWLHTLEQKWHIPANKDTVYFLELNKELEVKKTERELFTRPARLWMERSGCNTCHHTEATTNGPAYIQIAEKYRDAKDAKTYLSRKIKNGGRGVWGRVNMPAHPHLKDDEIAAMVDHILSLKATKAAPAPRKVVDELESDSLLVPGFGLPLEGLHPSYTLTTIRPDDFEPRVGALAFKEDGSLLVSTWDSVGAVYQLENVASTDSNQVNVRKIASGLAEPLGMTVVNDKVYVLQKQELTELIDLDGDGITDEYRNICNAWSASADFHEFSYGLVYQDGYFYLNLGLAMRLMAHEKQLRDRGRTIRVKLDGSFEALNSGLRQPNGIGQGIDGQIFMTENQGRWVPACKFIHLQEGVFHGCRSAIQEEDKDKPEKKPAVWLPQDDIGNSPGEPVIMNDGPYVNQMLFGEVTHGGIKRVYLEMVNGEYQGCVFRFSQGFEAGIGRMRWGPDGALYVGGVGMNGNWGWKGKQFGLQKIMYNGAATFEMLKIIALEDGFEIEFTQPLGILSGNNPEDYFIEQWRYEATENYGGPKLDRERLEPDKIEVSSDRKKVRLALPGLREGFVVYFRLSQDITDHNVPGNKLWAGEAWYTLNAIPRSEVVEELNE